ncbi:hypothetical protein Hanom_Chr13g01217931 [Helianthus anomalus]
MDSSEIWKGCLDKKDRWERKVVCYERIAWVKIHGVPFYLPLNPVFNVIGSRFGKIKLSWKGEPFSIWLEEERGDWIPECIEDLEEEVDVLENK